MLFCLTLLLLTLMVCMTLSIGMKAKEKMELKTAADAAAYSQAVATARTYNSISVLSRAFGNRPRKPLTASCASSRTSEAPMQ